MNKNRRAAISVIREKLDQYSTELEELMAEEEEYRDNMPENLQGSERYEKADEAASALGDAISSVIEAIQYLETACE